MGWDGTGRHPAETGIFWHVSRGMGWDGTGQDGTRWCTARTGMFFITSRTDERSERLVV